MVDGLVMSSFMLIDMHRRALWGRWCKSMLWQAETQMATLIAIIDQPSNYAGDPPNKDVRLKSG